MFSLTQICDWIDFYRALTSAKPQPFQSTKGYGTVRLVADENCDFSLVVDLLLAGYDVISIAEQIPGADDDAVIDFARSERRLMVTEDEGFRGARFCCRQIVSDVIDRSFFYHENAPLNGGISWRPSQSRASI